MSYTAQQTVNRSLRMLGVIDPTETPTDTQAQNALEAINSMVHGWAGKSVDIGHDDWALTDDVTLELDVKHIEGLCALGAITLQPEYPGSQISQAVAAIASAGWASLQAAFHDTSVDSDLVADNMFQHRRTIGWR